ncbi:Uncharacterised protein [Escherichia coli]|uniref:Uncharacterized protein n=1 Tax=Escherichia coli TaxID=562 RepID=A0A376MM57_ECOLX|nr:Uncharacterised protein [Escherichia coli]
MRQQGFDISQDFTRLLQLPPGKRALRTRKLKRTLGIHQTQANFPADIFQSASRGERLVVLIALMPFHNYPAQLLQVAVDIFNFICQLFDFGFEQSSSSS